jgi:hypothetical protein
VDIHEDPPEVMAMEGTTEAGPTKKPNWGQNNALPQNKPEIPMPPSSQSLNSFVNGQQLMAGQFSLWRQFQFQRLYRSSKTDPSSVAEDQPEGQGDNKRISKLCR